MTRTTIGFRRRAGPNIRNVLRQAIEACRPPTESWTVVTHEAQDGTVLTFDVRLDTEAPRSFTFRPEGDDGQRFGLFKRCISSFLGRIWLERLRVVADVYGPTLLGSAFLPVAALAKQFNVPFRVAPQDNEALRE